MDWLREPGFFGTHATAGADLSQLMATLFTSLFVVGMVPGSKRHADVHHWLMLGGMISMLSFFIAYYLFRQLGVLAVEGKEGFGGSQSLYDYVFIPVLTLHIILVIIGLIMAVYMIVLGFRSQQFVDGVRSSGNRGCSRHGRRSGSFSAELPWWCSGYFFRVWRPPVFQCESWRCISVYLMVVAFVFAIEMTIQRIWPDGAQRHRALGRFTMVIYCVLFVTGSFTYTMLYILYPGKIG